jgi:hypothetical protein
MYVGIGRYVRLLIFVLLLLGITACGAKPQASEHQPAPRASGQHRLLSELSAASPQSVRAFLSQQRIANGDIYLNKGQLVINVVDLTPEIEQRFADEFKPDTYRLANVRFTIEELMQAQQKLIDNDSYRKLNLYSSMVDVIANKVQVVLPDSSEEHIAKIESMINRDMIEFIIEALGEPSTVGRIVEVDQTARRILILEDGEEQPSIWYGFNDFSEIVGEDGEAAGFEDFSKDQRVKVWSTGLIAQSFPAQGTARKVEVISGEL